MRRSMSIVVLVATMVVLGALPAVADDAISLQPEPGTEFEIGERRYEGTLTVALVGGELALTETTTVDRYLAGIREVPFGWPDEALAAQVVAARTYLANTLGNGRSGRGAEIGYDICASSACQVYAGTSYLDEDHGDRWLAAVNRTAREILTMNDRPILAVYSSSAGSRTMAVQDVWGGEPLPYLQPVDSPEEGVSPFASWHIELPSRAFVEILAADGYSVGGDLIALDHQVPAEGQGIALVLVTTTGGTVTVLGTDLKGAMNRQGADLYPDLLPAARADGARQLPQSLPSYNYDVSYVPHNTIPPLVLEYLPFEDRAVIGLVVFDGEGWGHNLGMSQYGALSMALDGATYAEILSHYYSGIAPGDAGELLPDEVVVGLGWDLDSVGFTATGPFAVDGSATAGPRSGGSWSVISVGDNVVLAPTIGYPTTPDPRPIRPTPV